MNNINVKFWKNILCYRIDLFVDFLGNTNKFITLLVNLS